MSVIFEFARRHLSFNPCEGVLKQNQSLQINKVKDSKTLSWLIVCELHIWRTAGCSSPDQIFFFISFDLLANPTVDPTAQKGGHIHIQMAKWTGNLTDASKSCMFIRFHCSILMPSHPWVSCNWFQWISHTKLLRMQILCSHISCFLSSCVLHTYAFPHWHIIM